MANPGIKFLNTRELLQPDALLRESSFYREVMQVVGFRHAVGMFFWNDPPEAPEAIFSLHRGEGQVDFDDAEIALLDRLYPHVDAALLRVRVIEKERSIRKELRSLALPSAAFRVHSRLGPPGRRCQSRGARKLRAVEPWPRQRAT
jgi:hypothetical protein